MNLAKVVGLGALGLLAISGWTLWGNINNKRQLPTHQETLEILEEVRQQFFPVLIKIANLVTCELVPQGLPPSEN